MLEEQQKMQLELVNQLKKGHHSAYRDLKDLWYKRLYNYAYRLTNDHVTAEEVVQKSFIKVYKNIGGLKDAGSFTSWFYKIANNLCISEKRSQTSRNKYLTSVNEMPQVTDIQTPDKIYEKGERGSVVHRALQMISADQRQVILMKEFEGLKFREIADILGETESTVKSRLYYGLDNLKKIMLTKKWTKELYYE